MALLEINLRPSERDLRWFGLIMLLFFVVIGALVFQVTHTLTWPVRLAGAGLVFCAVYYGVRPLRKLLYLGWMRLLYPIGWTISHLLMGFIYFVVLTLIGWGLRLAGRDPMQRAILRDAKTYWIARSDAPGSARYFRQF
jgi:hypothetical protein